MDNIEEIPDDVCQVASATDNADEDESWACYQPSEGESTIKAALHLSSYTDYDIEFSNRTDIQWTTSGDFITESLADQTNPSDALRAASNQDTESKHLSNISNDLNFKSIQPKDLNTSSLVSGNFQDVENQSNNSNTICEVSSDWNTVDNQSSDLNMVDQKSIDLNIVEIQCNVLNTNELKTEENQISDLNIVGQQSNDLNNVGNQCNDLHTVGNQCYDLNGTGNQCKDLITVGDHFNDVNTEGNRCNDFSTVGNQYNDLNTKHARINALRKIKKRHTKKEWTLKGSFTLGVMLVLTLLETSNALPLEHVRNINKDCKPILSDSTPNEDDYKQIECAISTCRNVYRVVYERENTQSYVVWIPVFEGYSDNNFHALDANFGDTLNHRTDYTVFPNKHLLYIEPLRHDDQGKWRCVVYGSYKENYASEAVEVMVHVPPKDNSFNITPSTAYLVTGQTSNFTCTVDGVNPEPYVTWSVNGKEQRGGVAMNRKQPDGSWFIRNKIQLAFEKEGINLLSCIVKTDSRNPWLRATATIDVKETAHITNPREAMSIDVDLESTFTLNCSGSGYRPIITWQRYGVDILDNDERYIITHECDLYSCYGSLTPTTFDPNLACTETVYTAGVFTCVISLGEPFKYIQVSPAMTSHMSHAMICSGREIFMWTTLVFTIVIVLTLLMVVAFVGIRINTNRGYNVLRLQTRL